MKILVTGGVRSGKSRHAESLAAHFAGVDYVAPGPSPDSQEDPDWADRIARHRARRPGHWTTVETSDLAPALGSAAPVIVDCLGTWLTAVIDQHDLWDVPVTEVAGVVDGLLEEVAGILRERDDVILVTNEVGLGVVPSHRSGRLFRDLLGVVNQRLAAECDQVHLVVAGRVLVL